MNKHMIILPLLFVSATALLLLSLSLPEDTPQIVVTPSVQPSQLQVSASPHKQPQPVASTTVKPSALPTKSPSPGPSPTATPLPSFGIAATTPEAVLREAQANTGRMDPFKSILPPDLPEFAPVVEAEQLSYTQPPPLSTTKGSSPTQKTTLPTLTEPSPEPGLTDGLVLKGIINGGLDPIAIIQTADNSELVRVGDRLPGNILVTSIYFEGKYITLSRGNQKARLELEEE